MGRKPSVTSTVLRRLSSEKALFCGKFVTWREITKVNSFVIFNPTSTNRANWINIKRSNQFYATLFTCFGMTTWNKGKDVISFTIADQTFIQCKLN